jgi:hypothetical protein
MPEEREREKRRKKKGITGI